MINISSPRTVCNVCLVAFVVCSSPSFSQAELEPISPALRSVQLPTLTAEDPANSTAAAENRDFLVEKLKVRPAPDPVLAAELYGELGMLHHGLGLTESARISYDNAHLLSPTDPRWSYLLAVLAIEDGELDRARERLARILARAPRSIPALLRLAEVYVRGGDLADAVRTFEHALAAGGEREAIQSRLDGIEAGEEISFGTLADQANRADEVGLWFRDPLLESIHTLAESEPLPSLEGRLELRQGHYAEAAQAYYQLVALQPRDSAARVQLATALAGLGDVIRAFDQYAEAVRIDPGNVSARLTLGVLLAGQGATLSARHHLALVAEAEPDNPVAHRELAHVLAQLGELGDALVEFGEALTADKSDVASYVGAAQVLVRAEEFGQARKILETGLEMAPGDTGISHALARLLAASPDVTVRDGELALELSHSLIEKATPQRYSALVALALAETGRCSEAAEWQQRAIDHAKAQKNHTQVADLEEILPLLASGPPCRL